MTVSGNVGSKNSTRTDLVEARRVLRQKQATYGHQSGAALTSRPRSTLEGTLQALQWRKQFEPTNDPGIVRRGLWKFEREIEEERIHLAEDLVREVDPGPFEDPTSLAILAYQAASVEMAAGHRPDRGNHRSSRILLGTIASADADAFACVLSQSGYTIVGVHSALIDLIHQAARATVAAEHPGRSNDGKSDIKADVSPDALEMELSRNRGPVDRLYRTLEAYFFKGYPRASSNEELREEGYWVLTQMVGMAERFVIAHEIGHRFSVSLDWQTAASANNIKWLQEFSADQHSMIATVLSGQTLDHVDPAVSLSGSIFSLACLSMLGQGIGILRERRVPADEGSDSHPPWQLRAEQVVEDFHRFLHAELRPDSRGCLVTRIRKPGETIEVEKSVREHIRSGAFAHANALFVVWKRVQEMLQQDYDSGRQLHSMWTAKANVMKQSCRS